ncbi:MAG: hypothetical protein NTW96_02270 [Planctomycetia bacterium]|nr:hypothetical protein [Planctomycetia bacterium]
MRLAHKPQARRGVLLLVVLGMLAMFGVIGITFVILTSHERRGADAARRVEQYADPADDLLNQAMFQALAGTENTASVLRPHGLLEDLYGYPDVVTARERNGLDDDNDGLIDDANEAPFEIMASSNLAIVVPGGQLFQLYLTLPNASDANGNHTGGVNVDPTGYVGCVITMRTGAAAGRSSRIVGINPVAADRRAQVLSFDGVMPQIGDRYIINGVPFSGTGVGYNPSAGGAGHETEALLTATDPGFHNLPYALLPNPVAFMPNPVFTYADPTGPGGANEDYDAPDYQNMLLGLQLLDGTTPIPSLHRSALVQYWFTQLESGQQSAWFTAWPSSANTTADKMQAFLYPYKTNPDGSDYWGGETGWAYALRQQLVQLKRRIILRPLPELNDGFTGSNPGFNPLWDGVTAGGGQWDVDSDGDTAPDSIWVDLGMPARSTKDGRLFKPLFAILCVDLDGRLNLNAHGSLAQTDPNYQTPSTFPDAIVAGGGNQMVTPRGQGSGAADINLGALLANATEYQQLLMGATVGGSVIRGRYGLPSDARPGQPGPAFDPLALNLLSDYPNDWNPTGLPSVAAMAYGSPMDLKGTVAVGLDLRGQPLYYPTVFANMKVDQPYESNLSGPTTADSPFSVAELERLMRPYDADAGSLPGRIVQLAPTLLSNVSRRHEVTTESWSLPCPSVALTPELRSAVSGMGGRARHLVDLLRAKAPGLNDAQIAQLLPPEMLAGLKMDLNRPFGNGRDDNNNGVVDEPGEAELDYQLPSAGSKPGDEVAYPFDANNDGVVNAQDMLARQLYARHLYIQMLVLMNYHVATPGAPTDTEKADARRVAQWAVNIVDFRDRDAIMTPFEYDIEPFDATGWNVDGVIGAPSTDDTAPYRGLVWGCERPELLITETLAFHDRRTEDLPADGGTVAENKDNNNDFDQRVRPEGSLFVELYCPWTQQEPAPGEFYRDRSGTVPPGLSGVVLQQVTATGNRHPVWRLAITTREDVDKSPDDPDPAKRPSIERSVYFRDLSATPGFDDTKDGKEYYSTAAIAPVKPGQYAVIGPKAVTYIGRRSDGDLAKTRRIELLPAATPSLRVVFNRVNANTNDLPANAQQAPAAVIVDRPRRLSVSEPTDGYTDAGYDPGNGVYNPPLPQPLDAASDDAEDLQKTGTTGPDPFRVVLLQRLANPLADFNEKTNPYLTIDSMPISLTAFNGETSVPDPNDVGGKVMFHACQRGENLAVGANNLWQPPAQNKIVTENPAEKTVASHYFDFLLKHTLGYLNERFGAPLAGPTNLAATPPYDYKGDPPVPFPWLTWLNRPFTSEMELTLVPRWRSSELLENFGDASGGTDAYTKSGQPFPQMINFFYDKNVATAKPNWKLYRLLDLVHVPSRFVGTELQGRPDSFAMAGNHAFHPPFNRIPTYREPGRVNINTLVSQDVWRGVMNLWPNSVGVPSGTADALWGNLIASRRGYNASNMVGIDPTGTFPTQFANPFRSCAGLYMIPDVTPADNNAANNPLQAGIGREINATLLRAHPTTSETPLFELPIVASTNYNNRDQNPYFRYQVLERLGSLVTTRSNVYAMWITVGYFEVKPATDLTIHPDGYQLGQELGSDTGETRRHRAFYIIDRSIPVGFQRGKDLNVENAVLLKRYIE